MLPLFPLGLAKSALAGIWIFRHEAWNRRISGFALVVLADDLTRLGSGHNRGFWEVKVTEGGRQAGTSGSVQRKLADRPFGRKIANV
jgi:hypothetical protein